MNKTQKGFAALESLLILVIIAIIGGTGYFVWHSKNQANETLETADKSAQSPVSAQKYLKTDQNIKIPISGSIADAYYYVPDANSDGSHDSGVIGVKSLDGVSGCKPSTEFDSARTNTNVATGGVASISFDKYDSTRIANGESPANSNFKKEPNAVRIGNNWYMVEPNDSCKSSDAATQKQITAVQQSLVEAGKHAVAQ